MDKTYFLNTVSVRFVGMIMSIFVLGMSGCASPGQTPGVSEDYIQQQREAEARNNVEMLNQQINTASGQVKSKQVSREYHLGPGDVVDIAVFQVDELSKVVRINGRGTVILPMLGEVTVEGLTITQAEELLSEHLTDFLHDPQVSVFVTEYRSQEISVLGAVRQPGIKNVTRTRTLLEILTLAGGLNEKAGSQIYLQTTRIDEETQAEVNFNSVADIKQIVSNPEYNFVLKGGDTVYVPEAGTIFVEGAVNKPGAFPLEGETTVLKAIAQAGGLKYEISKDKAQIIRRETDADGKPVVLTVDLKVIQETGGSDVVLNDGDIVVVGIDAFKRRMRGIWRGFAGIFSIGFGI